ncbi:MAG: hypothetical protein OXC79_02640 [Candidatus Poribacteria bacterium]|nr:hypothetical protein [Candidatus Poribacteria bacterium]
MKKNLRSKIREYIQSEEGKVGVKTPLTLGVAAGGLLLAHAIVGPSVGTSHEDPGMCIHPDDNMGVDECPGEHVCTGPFYFDAMQGKHIGTCI